MKEAKVIEDHPQWNISDDEDDKDKDDDTDSDYSTDMDDSDDDWAFFIVLWYVCLGKTLKIFMMTNHEISCHDMRVLIWYVYLKNNLRKFWWGLSMMYRVMMYVSCDIYIYLVTIQVYITPWMFWWCLNVVWYVYLDKFCGFHWWLIWCIIRWYICFSRQ